MNQIESKLNQPELTLVIPCGFSALWAPNRIALLRSKDSKSRSRLVWIRQLLVRMLEDICTPRSTA